MPRGASFVVGEATRTRAAVSLDGVLASALIGALDSAGLVVHIPCGTAAHAYVGQAIAKYARRRAPTEDRRARLAWSAPCSATSP